MNEAERQTAEGILFTDQYQLTMAQVYFRAGLHEQQAQFDHFFRSYPNYGTHQAGYCVSAGLEWLLDWMQAARFRDRDIEYLAAQKAPSGHGVFADDFLAWLKEHGTFEGITLRAIPEGRVVHPNVPLTSVEGPMAMAQILETSLLNHLNFQTLIATKAALLHDIARGRLLMEFGLRRAHDKGGNAATRAALIGGADYSSNVGMSHVLGFPPKGTHAHSMVQLFMTLGEGEIGAFRMYADVYPDDCLLLVDTIDTLESGVPNAITVFEELRRKGHKPVGIRLDSGDLAYLSIEARRMLDEAGFPKAAIVASNDLDEHIITSLKEQGARINIWGVGTKLVTAFEQPALGGVYKLAAVRRPGGAWHHKVKLSEQAAKISNPGIQQVRRFYRDGECVGDMIYDVSEPDRNERMLVDPLDLTRRKHIAEDATYEDLLVPIFREGRRVYEQPSINAVRLRAQKQLDSFHPGVKRFLNPHEYPVGLAPSLYELRTKLILEARGENPEHVIPVEPAEAG